MICPQGVYWPHKMKKNKLHMRKQENQADTIGQLAFALGLASDLIMRMPEDFILKNRFRIKQFETLINETIYKDKQGKDGRESNH